MKTTRTSRRAARQLLRLCSVGDTLDAGRVRLVARRIARSVRRRDRGVLSEFKRLVRLDRQRHTAVVEAATTLDAEARKDIGMALARIYGPALETSFVRQPALIGGVRITVGSDVYDGSVRGSLAAIEARL